MSVGKAMADLATSPWPDDIRDPADLEFLIMLSDAGEEEEHARSMFCLGDWTVKRIDEI